MYVVCQMQHTYVGLDSSSTDILIKKGGRKNREYWEIIHMYIINDSSHSGFV